MSTTNPLGDARFTADRPLALNLDDTSTTDTTYIGEARIGTATSVAKWRIQKLDESSGLTIQWADGNGEFDNVWDDRVGLSYS